MFLIIWGHRVRTLVLGTGEFRCPACQAIRPYQHKRLARYFTLYFIPLFKTKTLGDYVECTACDGKFTLAVLEDVAQAAA